MSDIPFVHVTSATLQYQVYSASFGRVRECLQTKQIAILHHFDSSWNLYMTVFLSRPTFRHWEGDTIPLLVGADVEGSYWEEEWERLVICERTRL